MLTIYVTSFLLGLSSTLHCIAMCGPISLAIPLDRTSQSKKFAGIFNYQVGRLFVYAILGGLAGIVGYSTFTFGFMQLMSILSGVLLITYAWRNYFPFFSISVHKNILNLSGLSSKWMGLALHSNKNFKHFLLGMVNGILPCGMVYLGILNSLSATNPVQGALSMLYFGLGTFPSLFLIMIGWQSIEIRKKIKWNLITPILITIVGSFTILRGMNIGVPYISPKIQVETKKVTKKACSLKLDCCEKSSN